MDEESRSEAFATHVTSRSDMEQYQDLLPGQLASGKQLTQATSDHSGCSFKGLPVRQETVRNISAVPHSVSDQFHHEGISSKEACSAIPDNTDQRSSTNFSCQPTQVSKYSSVTTDQDTCLAIETDRWDIKGHQKSLPSEITIDDSNRLKKAEIVGSNSKSFHVSQEKQVAVELLDVDNENFQEPSGEDSAMKNNDHILGVHDQEEDFEVETTDDKSQPNETVVPIDEVPVSDKDKSPTKSLQSQFPHNVNSDIVVSEPSGIENTQPENNGQNIGTEHEEEPQGHLRTEINNSSEITVGNLKPKLGDLIAVKRFWGYFHYMVYVGFAGGDVGGNNDGDCVHGIGDDVGSDVGGDVRDDSCGVIGNVEGYVVHLTLNFDWNCTLAKVKREKVNDVIPPGSHVYIESRGTWEGKCPLPAGDVIKRALSIIGRKGFHPLSKNCEHFARWCKYGVAYSRQAEVYRQCLKRVTCGLWSCQVQTAVASMSPQTSNIVNDEV